MCFLVHVKMGNCAQIVRSSLLGCANSVVAPCREQRDSVCTVTFGRTCRPLRELNWIILVNMHRLKDAKVTQPMTKWCRNKSNGHFQESTASLRAAETELQHARVKQSLSSFFVINPVIYKVQKQILNIHQASAMLV